MVQRLKKLGYAYEYTEYPGLGHNVWDVVPYAQVEDRLLEFKLDKYPKDVVFRTPSLRYNGAYWAWIDRFEKAGAFAEIRVLAGKGNTVDVKTGNVRQFSLDVKGNPLFDASLPVAVKIDAGQTVSASAGNDGKISFRKDAEGNWKPAGEVSAAGLEKKPCLQGGLQDVYSDRFIYVYGTAGKDAEVNKKVATAERDNIAGSSWGKMMGDFTVKKDSEVTDQDIADANLILIGDPAGNSLTKRIADRTPLAAIQDLPGKAESSGAVHFRMIYPNPLNPEKYVVIYFANDPAKFEPVGSVDACVGDYEIFIFEANPWGGRGPKNIQGGMFDSNWKLSK
jgi:hypothetical protein